MRDEVTHLVVGDLKLDALRMTPIIPACTRELVVPGKPPDKGGPPERRGSGRCPSSLRSILSPPRCPWRIGSGTRPVPEGGCRNSKSGSCPRMVLVAKAVARGR